MSNTFPTPDDVLKIREERVAKSIDWIDLNLREALERDWEPGVTVRFPIGEAFWHNLVAEEINGRLASAGWLMTVDVADNGAISLMVSKAT